MRKLTTAGFVEKARKKHGDRYDLSRVDYKDTRTKVEIGCSVHGRFPQIPRDHLSGHGCPECGNEAIGDGLRSNTEDFIAKARKEHGDRYDYSRVVYKAVHTKIEIGCPVHGWFPQTPHGHLSGYGCDKCGGTQQSNTEDFIAKARKEHGDRYDYSRVVYKAVHTKIEIGCPVHGWFWQTPAHHLSGHGCDKCSSSISKPGTAWLDSLGVPLREYHLKIFGKRGIRVDGFNPTTNTAYQFHGDFWHGNPKHFPADTMNPRTKCAFGVLYQRTLACEQAIRDAGYNLGVMWESEWKAFVRDSKAEGLPISI